MNFEIENLDKLAEKLNKLSNIKLNEALQQACLLVERDAKILCPVGDGELRNSITHEIVDNVGYVGSNCEYAPYVHQGTGIYAVNGDGRKEKWSYEDAEGNWHTTIGQHPNPFLDKAVAQNRDQIIEIFINEIQEARKKL